MRKLSGRSSTKKERKIYETEFAAYKKTRSYHDFEKLKSDDKLNKAKKMKAPKDPNRPKKPLSAYFLFLRKFRAENSNLGTTEVSKAGGAAWKILPEDEKKVYTNKALAEKEKYRAIEAAYKKTPEFSDFQEKLEAFKEMKKRKLNALIKKQKDSKPAGSDQGESDSE